VATTAARDSIKRLKCVFYTRAVQATFYLVAPIEEGGDWSFSHPFHAIRSKTRKISPLANLLGADGLSPGRELGEAELLRARDLQVARVLA
jgi:hypothetical protein